MAERPTTLLVLKSASSSAEAALLADAAASVDVLDIASFLENAPKCSPPRSSSASSLGESASDSSASSSAAAPSSASSSSSRSYDAVVVCGPPPADVDLFSLARTIFRVANSSASCFVLQNCDNSEAVENGETEAAATLRKLRRQLMYSGFVAASRSDLSCGLLSIASASRRIEWCGRKPTWEAGAFQVVGARAAATGTAVNGVVAASKEAELIDESALIQEENYVPLGKDRSSCASRPKPCANCTCGRREQVEAEGRAARRKKLETGEVRSSCGSCYLGDAFRCAGCPYRGLPAFKPGEKVSLVNEAPSAPAPQRRIEKQMTTVSASKVQLMDLTDD